MKTIVICLDSFKPSYLKHTPFLRSLSQKYSQGTLETVYGYTGIGAAIATGKFPQDTRIWREFKFSQTSPFWIFKSIPNNLPQPMDQLIRLGFNISFNLLRFIRNQHYFLSIRQVPFSTLPFLTPSMIKGWYQSGSTTHPSIFDLLRSQNQKLFYHDWPSVFYEGRSRFAFFSPHQDIDKLSLLSKNLKTHDFFWLRLWQLDSLAHQFGLDSPRLTSHLNNLDYFLKSHLRSTLNHPQTRFLFWSDHGMVPVTQHIDPNPLLSHINSPYFVDSTGILFKNPSHGEKKIIKKSFRKLPGFFLTRSQKALHRLGNLDEYGQLIFLTHPGVVFTPNFYSKFPVKGMHGYLPSHPDQLGIYITNIKHTRNKPLKLTQLNQLLQTQFPIRHQSISNT